MYFLCAVLFFPFSWLSQQGEGKRPEAPYNPVVMLSFPHCSHSSTSPSSTRPNIYRIVHVVQCCQLRLGVCARQPRACALSWASTSSFCMLALLACCRPESPREESRRCRARSAGELANCQQSSRTRAQRGCLPEPTTTKRKRPRTKGPTPGASSFFWRELVSVTALRKRAAAARQQRGHRGKKLERARQYLLLQGSALGDVAVVLVALLAELAGGGGVRLPWSGRPADAHRRRNRIPCRSTVFHDYACLLQRKRPRQSAVLGGVDADVAVKKGGPKGGQSQRRPAAGRIRPPHWHRQWQAATTASVPTLQL